MTVVGLNPMSERTGFVAAVRKSFKGNINLQAAVL